jgi:hypothetical protein
VDVFAYPLRSVNGAPGSAGQAPAPWRILDLTGVRGLLTGQGANAAESPTVEPEQDMDSTHMPDPPGRREPEPA